MLKPHLRLLLIHIPCLLQFHHLFLMSLQYNLIPYSAIPHVATLQLHPLFLLLLRYCTVQHHPLFLLVLLYTSVQRHVATVQTRHLFLMMLPPHPLLLMLLQAYNLVLNYFSCHSRQYNLTLSSLCYYNLILYYSLLLYYP